MRISRTTIDPTECLLLDYYYLERLTKAIHACAVKD